MKIDPYYLEPRYRLKQAAAAADFPLNTLRSYYQRGWFGSDGNEVGRGKGRAQRLCLGDVLVLAIASRMIGVGRSPLDAYNGARSFGLVTKKPRGMPGRRPFELFDRENFNSLFVSSLGSAAQVVPVRKGKGLSLDDLGLDEEFGDATIVISLNAVERTVFEYLGLPLPDQASGGRLASSLARDGA